MGHSVVDEDEFRRFLRRSGRSAAAAARCVSAALEFERWLAGRERGPAGGIEIEHVVDYVSEIEGDPKDSAKTQLWALTYFFEFTNEPELKEICRALRQERIDRKPFALRGFRGIDPDSTDRLAAIGISNIKDLLAAGGTPADRESLATRAGLPVDKVTELVKLSDLARIPGIKGVRARLYHDAGIETVEALAEWAADELHEHLARFCAETRFEGATPLPKEIEYSIVKARGLSPTIV